MLLLKLSYINSALQNVFRSDALVRFAGKEFHGE